MNSPITSSEVQQFIVEPLNAARAEQKQLIPIVGAGLSVPLGLPAWSKLKIVIASEFNLAPHENEQAAQFFQRVEAAIGDVQYHDCIRRHLKVAENQTTLALQSLVASGIRAIATTNLDYAIETAFDLSGRPLKPQCVYLNAKSMEVCSLGSPSLIKLHGSLEEPASWVMTQKDYNTRYKPQGGDLHHWWFNLAMRPLFLGAGASDEDVLHAVRFATLQRDRGGFIVMRIDQIRKHLNVLQNAALKPIAIDRFDKVAEVIDEIFGCEPLRIEETRASYGTIRRLRVGAANIALDADEQTTLQIIKDVANAVELQTHTLVSSGLPRRQHGAKRSYLTYFAGLNNSDNLQPAEIARVRHVIQALMQYADVFFDEFMPRLLDEPEVLKKCWTHIWDGADATIKNRLMEFLLRELENRENCRYDRQKGIANILAKKLRRHPANSIPPRVLGFRGTIQFEAIELTQFVLTRAQVGELLRDPSVATEFPLRPFLIRRSIDIARIIQALDLIDDAYFWRLPSQDEWLMAALQVGTKEETSKWPWGNTDPEPKIHAHLKFVAKAGGPESQPVEVGLFPKGRSPGGFYDLVGNVYELVFMPNSAWASVLEQLKTDVPLNEFKELALAGGAYTTTFKDRTTSRWQFISHLGRSPNPNIGLRLVRVRKSK